MKFNDLIRIGIVVATLGYVFGGDLLTPKPKPDDVPAVVVEDYKGELQALHNASRSMEEADRAAMSATFDSGARQLDADAKDLVNDTQKLQTYVIGLLSFGYGGVEAPLKKYPEVSREVEKIMVDQVGEDIVPLDRLGRDAFVLVLKDMAKAVR